MNYKLWLTTVKRTCDALTQFPTNPSRDLYIFLCEHLCTLVYLLIVKVKLVSFIVFFVLWCFWSSSSSAWLTAWVDAEQIGQPFFWLALFFPHAIIRVLVSVTQAVGGVVSVLVSWGAAARHGLVPARSSAGGELPASKRNGLVQSAALVTTCRRLLLLLPPALG